MTSQGTTKKHTSSKPEKIGVTESLRETQQAWRALLRPRVLITTGVILLIILIIFLLIQAYTIVTAELSITLTPAEQIVNGPDAQVHFNIRTNNILACEAICSATLTRLHDNVTLVSEQFILGDDNTSVDYSLSAPISEGETLYSLTVSCINIDRTFCKRENRSVQTSALIVHQYDLPAEVAEIRALLELELNEFFTLLAQSDIALQEEQALLLGLAPYGRTGFESLVNDDSLLFIKLKRMGEELRQEWNKRNYDLSVPLEDVRILNRTVHERAQALRTYYDQQHLLVALFNEPRDPRVQGALAQTSFAGEYAANSAAYAALGRAVVSEPATQVPERLETLAANNLAYRALVDEAKSTLKMRIEKLNAILLAQATSQNETYDEMIAETTLEGLWNQTQTLCVLANESCPIAGTAHSFFPHDIHVPETNPSTDIDNVALPNPVCCGLACKDCCTTPGCGPTPVLFLHGHSMNARNAPEYTLGAFTQISQKLTRDGLLIDAGILSPYSRTTGFPESGWGQGAYSLGVHGTYYYDTYLSGSSYVLSLEQSESIDTYAIRLNDLVRTLRERTGQDKVIIVAHSMGGLVARRYLQLFGDDRIEMLITIGTPHRGLEQSIARLCPVLGADKECQDLRATSPMIARINDPNDQPSIPIYSIVGRGCDTAGQDGDGVVTVKSASYGDVRYIDGSCTRIEPLHTTMLKPELYPGAYRIIKELLQE